MRRNLPLLLSSSVLFASLPSLASTCIVDSSSNAGIYSPEQISLLSQICGNYRDRLKDRYGREVKLVFSSFAGDNAEFDLNHPPFTLIKFEGDNVGDTPNPSTTLAAILCHEIGHGLAHGHARGATRTHLGTQSEGQADYFAVSCMKELISKSIVTLDPKEIEAEASADVKRACEHATNPTECFFILSAMRDGLTAQQGRTPRYGSKAPARAFPLIGHPPDRCRLSTFEAAYFNRAKPKCWKGWIPIP